MTVLGIMTFLMLNMIPLDSLEVVYVTDMVEASLEDNRNVENWGGFLSFNRDYLTCGFFGITFPREKQLGSF